MKAKTVKEALVATKWMLENIGWTQRCSYRDRFGEPLYGVAPADASMIGSMCLVGAISLVEADEHIRTQMRAAIGALVDPVGSPITYNDQSFRTKEDVIALLDQAIERQP